MKIRHFTAALGVAIAAGSVVFMRSLTATNDHQAAAVAEKLVKTVPVAAEGADVCRMTLDYRPGGRVMQGPPMSVTMIASAENPSAVKLGKWECAVTKALFAQRGLKTPPAGTVVTFVGRSGAYRLKIAGIIDWERPLRGYPNVFVSGETADEIGEMWSGWKPKTAAELSAGFRSDDQRHIDRAKILLLWAAALTALCLVFNALTLSVEARRREIALLRIVGMTRAGTALEVLKESAAVSIVGAAAGAVMGVVSLFGYVALDGETFPMGAAVDFTAVAAVAAATVAVALLAAAMALKSALGVQPLEAAAAEGSRSRSRAGMLVAFACGFGAFVAVEVWGASLMSAFVPSPAWPDAVVSMLPGGMSGKEAAAIGGLEGVKWVRPVQVRQVGTRERNVLLIGAESTPRLKFPANPKECYITSMMARARNLRVGDEIEGYRIGAVVDLNWHMVTSRSLMRGLDRRNFTQKTDGPVLVAPWQDRRGRITHLWLDYEDAFLKKHGVFEAGRKVERQLERDGMAVRLHARDEIADGTLAHGVDIIGAMAKIPFIFVAVVSLGFIAMLVAAADLRRREFALLRAVGATRLSLTGALAFSALKTALAGVVLGFVFGSLAGWLFTAVTRSAMANWGLPPAFAVPVAAIAKGAVGAVVFALAVAIPASAAIVFKSTRR